VSGLTSPTGSEVEAWRQLSLEELPPVLILHLKRFVYEKNGNRIHKIDKKLDFGVDLEIGKGSIII
jgi:ubiquitin carboxyl-terminal hydrolase 10